MVNEEDSSSSSSSEGVSREKTKSMLSPGFQSIVEMAGWDEEALLCATLIVEDTPVRNSKQRKRSNLLNSPLSTSTRKRRTQKRRTIGSSMPVALLSLDEDPPAIMPIQEETEETEAAVAPPLPLPPTKILHEIAASDSKSQASSSTNAAIPCIDKLRDELSCAICLDICYEPSTTPCGHSFCKRCLKNAAYKCGRKCPKCRQLISNGRSCTINTVLWNTIQLLFPQEVEARKACDASNGKEEAQGQNAPTILPQSLQNGSVEPVSRGSNRRSSRQNMTRQGPFDVVRQRNDDDDVVRRNNNPPIQDEDAALALRLQREEFMGVFEQRRSHDAPPPLQQTSSSSFASARANLRAMASRATSIRLRGRTT